MKALKFITIFYLISFPLFFAACNDGGGGSSDTGTVSMSVTDAKPLLPENVTNLFVTFSDVWVHKSGGGWIPLDLVESPYTIDLLQFQDGETTELVPPAELSSGKYTQVRIVVESATMRSEIKNDEGSVTGTEDRTLEIPSGNLKTDKNFTIDVGAESAMDIVIHFDLGMSVVVSGPESDPTYSLKPVMHLFQDPLQAATINGIIYPGSFVNGNNAIIVVLDEENQEFTRLEVTKESDTDPTRFSIYWLVPDRLYKVQIDLDKDNDNIDDECHETVNSVDLGPGETYELNGEQAITGPNENGFCI